MLGWEFPPQFAGGVGMVCHELAKEFSKHSEYVDIEYVMPYGPKSRNFSSNFKIVSANSVKVDIKSNNLNFINIPTFLQTYDEEESYETRMNNYLQDKSFFSRDKTTKEIYGANILKEVELYAQRVAKLCKNLDFDVIHAHDWTTVYAALLLKKITGKPVIYHVHITEFDKTGGNKGSKEIFEIERKGFLESDILVAVSNFTKSRIINNYNISEDKIRVVHNGGISNMALSGNLELGKREKIVLFAGRMTLQKGPEYFIKAAKKVLDYDPDVKFILAGTGDLQSEMMELAAELGISKNLYFHGFYTREDANNFFALADIFVMPSVSEPFGIVPLEAIAKGTPVIISKQSGISEVLDNSFKVDFWDIDDIAHKILVLLKYPHLHNEMRVLARDEFNNFTWDKPVHKLIDIYNEVINN